MDDNYKTYLRSAEWREKRKQFLEEVDYECEECGEKATQIHHLNYDCLGEEERDDVQILCKECHEIKEMEKGTDMECNDEFDEY
jgi:5-methylcytosine-specific restriction endonuclease McrA